MVSCVNMRFRPVPFKASEVFGQEAPCWLEVGWGWRQSHRVGVPTSRDRFCWLGSSHARDRPFAAGSQRTGLTNVRVKTAMLRCFFEIGAQTHRLTGFCCSFRTRPKKRHHKRRILQPSSQNWYREASRWWRLPRCDRLAALRRVHAGSPRSRADAHQRVEQRLLASAEERTKFERRGLRLGHDVWDLIYTREAASSKAASRSPYPRAHDGRLNRNRNKSR